MTAIIFDFDGTIMDSESVAYKVWSEIFAEHGATLSLETWVQCVGKPMGTFNPCEEIEKQTGKKVDHKALTAKKQDQKSIECDHLQTMEGVKEVIAFAKSKDLKLAVGSSSNSKWVEHHLSRMNLRSDFESVVCVNHVAKGKPDPDIFLQSAKNLGVKPEECIVLEDSVAGIEAANRAGMKSIAIPNPITKGSDFSHANIVLGSLLDLESRVFG